MKSMVIGGIILIIALLAGTYFAAGDAFNGDDYINSLTMLGAVAIITITVFVALKYVNQMRNDTASGDLAEERWDGIGEYRNSVPTGWALAFIGTIIWMFWYFTVGYPINGFSQIGQWNEETLEYNAKFEKKWENPSEETLKAMGQSTFLVQCAPCHGVDAEGIDGKAQNLTKRISKEQVVYVIKNGANNFKSVYPDGMPPMMLTEDADINAVADYIAGGFKGEQPASFAACSSCHGEDGKGMEFVAPNIRAYDDAVIAAVLKNGANNLTSTYPAGMPPMMLTEDADINAVAEYVAGGFKGEQPASFATCSSCHGEDGKGMESVAPNIRAYDDALVMAVLKDGKKGSIGAMPSFSGRLNETQEKALAAYLRSIEGK